MAWLTWAYGYASWKTDGTSNWTNFISDANKTILSMQYDATQSLWDEVKAVGKPTTSHIPANGTQVQTGWDRGGQTARLQPASPQHSISRSDAQELTVAVG